MNTKVVENKIKVDEALPENLQKAAPVSTFSFRYDQKGNLMPSAAFDPSTGIKIASFTTNVDVVNTTTETTIWSFTLTGNKLGTTGVLVGRISYGGAAGSGVSSDRILRLKYGGTTIATLTITSSIVTDAGFINFIIQNAGTTNSQEGEIFKLYSAQGSGTALGQEIGGARGTSAIDSTTDQTVSMTIQFSTASLSVGETYTNGYAFILV